MVTGTWDILARRLLDCLDLSDPRVIGSTVRPWAGGLVADEHCYGPRKVRMLTAHGFPPPWTCVLTDSASDLPLLEGGGTRQLVNPTVTTRAAVTRRLGDRNRLVHWELSTSGYNEVACESCKPPVHSNSCCG